MFPILTTGRVTGISSYTPDDASCAAWYGESETLPGALTEHDDSAYSGANLTTVSTDDTNYVAATVVFYNYAGHRVYFVVDAAPGDVLGLDVTLKPFVDAGGAWAYLYIYNYDTSLFELLDSYEWSGPGDDGVKTLMGSITSGAADYVNNNGGTYEVSLKLVGDNANDSYLAYCQLDVTAYT